MEQSTSDALNNRRVLITGAGAGIGAVTARILVERGARVAVFDLDTERAAETARSLGGGRAFGAGGDVADISAIERTLEAMKDRWGGVDDLVNNAGIHDHGALLDLSEDQWRRVMEVNLMAPLLISNAVVRRIGDGGSIVNVSSVLGQVLAPGRGPYCISKSALISLTKLQAIEWADRGIRVNAVAPGYIMNDTTRELAALDSFESSAICGRTPMGRFGTEQEVAESICFLLDPTRSGYITGHVLEVNGGWTAYGFV